MRQLALILLWFCAVNQAQAKSDDYLKLTINARVYVTACAAWVEDGAGVMSGNITLPPVPLSELQHPKPVQEKRHSRLNFNAPALISTRFMNKAAMEHIVLYPFALRPKAKSTQPPIF
ncbi:hypothetical protein CEW81_15205 [Kluyvera genomosp. 3]|uniref:Fimbrial protein n=1 Tax=Kluyvera genomosp. 3 TaxID=2774055 RepID=A0A248KJE4_9ENTR|nr:hypothetical protein CEW81_15205 [Kluyvera genomosp. 3]